MTSVPEYLAAGQVLRYPLRSRVGIVFGFVAVAWLIPLYILVFAVGPPDMGLRLLFCALLVFAIILTRYMYRELRYKLGWRAELSPDRLDLRLPDGRGLYARLGDTERVLSRAQLAGLEDRLEGYSSFGLGTLNRTHALRLTDGSRIVLGETRGLGSVARDSFVGAQAAIIAGFYGLPVTQLPPAIGKGGLLGIVGTKAPAADAVASDEQWQAHLAACRRTGLTLAFTAGFLTLVFGLLALV